MACVAHSQGTSALAAITGLYLFSRKMVLPRRAKLAISLLTSMAYLQVRRQPSHTHTDSLCSAVPLNRTFVFSRSSWASPPCCCTSPPPSQPLTSLAPWLFCLWPFGFWQSSAKCPNDQPLLPGQSESRRATLKGRVRVVFGFFFKCWTFASGLLDHPSMKGTDACCR